MSTREIVEKVAKGHWVEESIKAVTGGLWRPEYKDLTQDILLELWDMDPCKLEKLYKNQHLKFFIRKVVRNNIQSKTSRFYYRYRRFSFLNAGPDSIWFTQALDPSTEEL